jgi:hypothetical protein
MTESQAPDARLDRALWIGVAAGLFADLYLPFGVTGGFVASNLGLVWPVVVLGCLASVVWLCIRGLEAATFWTWLLLAAGAVSCFALAVLNLMPPFARDELTHHLAIPALFLRAGRVAEIPFADQAYYPMLVTLLYTPLLAHGWESAAKYLHLAFGIATAALVCLDLQRRVATTLAVFGGLLILTTPTVMVLGASAYVDLGLLFFSTIALLAALRWSESGRLSLLVPAALGAGCAATVKYNGYLMIPLIGFGIVLLSRRRTPPEILRALVTYGLISIVPLVPWLVRNFVETGNPMFPLLQGVFGGRELGERPSIDVFTYRHVLYGESWLQVALTPIRVFLTGQEGEPARFDGVFNPLLLLGFFAPFFPGATRRNRVLAGFAAAVLLMVFFLVAFRSRYAIAVLAPLTILSVETIATWSRRSAAWRATCAALIIGSLAFNTAHFATFWDKVDPLAFLSGRESRAEFISRFVPEYPVVHFANSHLPEDATVYLAFLGQRGYFWERSYTYDFHYSGVALRDAVQHTERAHDIAARLREEGVSHIASVDQLLARYLSHNLDEAEQRRWQEFAAQHLRLLFRQGGVGLYEIV